ncbi:MAG: bifunctional molybdenum cofactor biosynthesis protein MoaC/MoaB [Thaumarchaeota archaeon]|nr:bifunctional molybdenum cofactor biosynthesis protein MoaC/MoaB [Nitrososphaerota archaeon]
MFDVANKPDTLRRAVALAIVKTSPESIQLVKEGRSPKGDIIETAKIAATMAAKKTWDLLPYCHSIPIDNVKVDIELKESSIEVRVETKTVWKTGVEMESLTAASIAALTIYDMLKPVDDNLSIESIKLLEKSGGIKGISEKGGKKLRAAVLVISDSTSQGTREDKSGKLAVETLKKNGFEISEYAVVADDLSSIESSLAKFCDELKVDLVITTGGTGIGPRDVTPEATRNIIEKEMQGLSEAMRTYGQRRTPLSMLSRGISGVRGNTLVVNMPGSTKAVSESFEALFPGLLHIYKMLGGYGH